MKFSIAVAATANMAVGATASGVEEVTTLHAYAAFETPPSRYGNYAPDMRRLKADPFVTSPCSTRASSQFPAATTVWNSNNKSPCITIEEVGPFANAAYTVSLLDSSGVAVHEEDFAAEPVGNDLRSLRQVIDPNSGLPIFEWCQGRHQEDLPFAKSSDRDPWYGDRDCLPHNDLIVAYRAHSLTLPEDLRDCKDCTLQLAAKDSNGHEYFACANVDVEESEGSMGVDYVCEAATQGMSYDRYQATVSAAWAPKWFWEMWKWTFVFYIVAYALITIATFFVGRREKQLAAETNDLPFYAISSDAAVSKSAEGEGRRLLGDAGGVRSSTSGHAFFVGYRMAIPRRARFSLHVLVAFLSFVWIIAGIAGALLIFRYQF